MSSLITKPQGHRGTAKNILFILFALAIHFIPATAQAVPPIEEARLNNGLRILLMQAHNVPMVSMQLTLPAGSRFDPEGQGGSASMLAAMLSDHTARHDFVAWANLLDAEAIRLGAGAGRDNLDVSLTVLKEVLPAGIHAFTEALLQPGWDIVRFEILKEDAVAAAQKAQEEPGIRASEALGQLVFGTHPYGHRPDGSLESLKRIELSSLKRLYRSQVKPEEAVLAVSGDIDMPELLKLLVPLLKDWQGAPETGLFTIDPPLETRGLNEQVEMETKQALVSFGRLGPDRKAADFFPAFVLNHILGGGGFSSILMEEVREKRGLVYGIYSYFVPLAVPGPYVISLQTRADQADQASQVVRDVLAELFEKGVTDKQLQDAKANLMGSFAQRMDSNRERVGLISMIGFYDLPPDYLQAWTDKVNAVSIADIKQAAGRYLNPDDWNQVRVGPLLENHDPQPAPPPEPHTAP